MDTTEQDVDGLFVFPDQSSHPAQVHRFECQCGQYQFWFGIAHFLGPLTEMPQGIIGGRCIFDDGRAGLVSFQTAADFDEPESVSFIGVSRLR